MPEMFYRTENKLSVLITLQWANIIHFLNLKHYGNKIFLFLSYEKIGYKTGNKLDNFSIKPLSAILDYPISCS
jgi:hypothetical protein